MRLDRAHRRRGTSRRATDHSRGVANIPIRAEALCEAQGTKSPSRRRTTARRAEPAKGTELAAHRRGRTSKAAWAAKPPDREDIRLRLLLALGLLTTILAQRSVAQRWEPEHVVLATTSTTFILLDWITTADAVRRCGTSAVVCTPSVEQNPLLGPSPSLTTLRTWSLLAIGANLAGGALLRRRWMRTAWFAGVTMIEYSMVQHNVRAGLRLSLRF